MKCPCCGVEIEVDAASGQVIRHGPKGAAGADGKPDIARFDAALQNVKGRGAQAQSAFDRAKDALKNRESKLDSAFKDAFKKVKETDDGSKPLSPFDLE